MVNMKLYGGKRGFVAHISARVLYALGAYGNVRDIDWSAVKRLVFVCQGNICRSPYASIKARSLGVISASFGLEAAPGAPADPAASRNSIPRGIDLSGHRSARMDVSCLADGDLIVVFEPRQLAEVRRQVGDRLPTILLGIWSRPRRPHIHDPYGQGDGYFQQCFSVIDVNVTMLVESIAGAGAPAMKRESVEVPCPNSVFDRSCDRTLG